MTKIRRYIGLDGAKQIWKETGEKFIDNTELDYILDNIQMNFDRAELVLTIPSRTSSTPKQLKVDIRKLFGESGELKKYLSPGEYDEETGMPNFAGSPNVIYLVPSSGSTETSTSNEYTEWMYNSENGWEMVGTPPISSEDIMNIVNGL